MKLKSLVDSFNYAISGFIHALRTQRNMKIHVVTTLIILITSLFFGVSRMEFIAVIISITLVITAELFNTAVESTIDATLNHYHPLAKIAKNTAAAGVLITALNAALVGYVIFFEKLINFTNMGISYVKDKNIYMISMVLIIVSLLVLLIKATVGEGTPLRGGMPSGHAALAFAISTMISYLSSNAVVLILSIILAIIVCHSRVELKIHSFYEVLAGAVIGILVTLVILKFFNI